MFVGILDKQTSQCKILSLKFDENVFSPENKSPEKQQRLLINRLETVPTLPKPEHRRNISTNY